MSNHIDSMLRNVYEQWKRERPKDGSRSPMDFDGCFKDIAQEQEKEIIRYTIGEAKCYNIKPISVPVEKNNAVHCHKLVCSKCMSEELLPTNRVGVRLDPGCWLCVKCNAVTYFNYPEL